LELYHKWLRKGEAAEDHKYTRREWRNGRWYYYYDDGSVTEDYPKGQNYKTKSNNNNSTQQTTKTTVNKKDRSIPSESSSRSPIDHAEQLIKNGVKAIDKLEYFMGSRIADLSDSFTRDATTNQYQKGQNYTVRKDR